jgi:hypothetical protein
MTTRLRWIIIVLWAQLAVPAVWAQEVLFTPENGLSGSSQGDGTLSLFLGPRRHFHVHSFGQSGSDNSFVLKQTVAFAGQEARTRSWNIQQVSPLHYAGTLSDAAGAVSAHTSGQCLILKYRIKGPLVMHQVLELMPDGKTVDNVGRITLFGIPIGFVHETIRRGD